MRKAQVFAITDPVVSILIASTGPGEPNYVLSGHTDHFYLYYQRKLGPSGDAIAQTLKARCEVDFQQLAGMFAVTPADLPFHVYVTADISGAMHYGCANTEIYVGTLPGLPPTTETYSLLLAAEIVEVFEAAINNGWNCGFSHGEGLSRVLATYLHPKAQIPSLVTAPVWLDKVPPLGGNRFNWIDDTDPLDTNPFSAGCAVLFLNWLNSELKIPWDGICRAGGKYLEDTYESLLGTRNGWTKFKAEIDKRFPPGVPSGLTSDNPF